MAAMAWQNGEPNRAAGIGKFGGCWGCHVGNAIWDESGMSSDKDIDLSWVNRVAAATSIGVDLGAMALLGSVPGIGAAGASSLDELSRAAAAADRGGLTAAGRALQKHGGRSGSAFPAASGNPAQINQAGQSIVDDILMAPGSTQTMRSTGRFGDVVEVVAPDGRGVRFSGDGKFIGFLEPPQ